MKKVAVFFLAMLIFSNLFSQKITDSAKIYILTCSPGDELYQAFGHTAFWVVDDSIHLSYIYHYGTFNFSDPDFYMNFVRGKLNYMLALEGKRAFLDEYSSDGRDVWKMELNLTFEQKQRLVNFLTWKSQPENRYYLYDFFMDNCATRVRGVLENTYGDSLVYPNLKVDLTYRESIKPYLQAKPWIRFGTNLLLGLPADKKLDYYSAMFLPDFIDTVFSQAKLKTPNGEIDLGLNREYMIKSDYKIGPKPFFNPSNLFWLIFVLILVLTIIEIKAQKNFKGVDFSVLFLMGLMGLIMLFMWLGTDHSPTKWNLNILWAFPTHIFVAFMLFKKKNDLFIKKYFLIFSIVNVILAVTMWFLLPQQYDVAVFPILLILITRFGGYLMKK
ncbi:MAG: DUF4105 domain-containing protein [Bacteroidales bacterium]|nr:DUF4105 domain-containing protein [Bacteroidales bacterium]